MVDMAHDRGLMCGTTRLAIGSCVFNILMLGVVHQGVAFPPVWCVLDKRGASNVDERATLFNEFLFHFGNKRTAKSIFRYGFDHLRNIVFDLEQRTDEFLHVVQFLSST